MNNNTMYRPEAKVLAFSPPLVETRYDSALRVLWINMARQKGQPQNFSTLLLQSLQNLIDWVNDNGCVWSDGLQEQPVHYAILQSGHPTYFSVGGDLKHFLECIQGGDFQSLRSYSMQCLDMMYRWATNITNKSTTIALVQGRALGGGFETALSADYIIAEEQSEFGLPEILFGLFPCTGGMSLLARRVGLNEAEKMMRNGRIYSAVELYEMGIVEHVCARGSGERATRDFIAEHGKRRKARHALQQAKHRMMPLNYEELAKVVDDWVAAAMHLTDEEMRVLETLVRMQRSEFAH